MLANLMEVMAVGNEIHSATDLDPRSSFHSATDLDPRSSFHSATDSGGCSSFELKPEKRTRCEVWTRVMGYHRPVSAFNVGKKQEHLERRLFLEAKSGLSEGSL
jgi:hypothetical protein